MDFTGPAPASMHYAGAKHQKKLAEANRNGTYMMEEEEQEDRTFGIGQAFHQLSQADKERMEEVHRQYTLHSKHYTPDMCDTTRSVNYIV